MAKIMNLLHEFEDPFSMRFSEMKGILGDVGEIKIMLKPNAKPVQQIPYRLNPWSKDRVKAEIDQMLDDAIIDPVEESKWISPVVVKSFLRARSVPDPF